MSVVHEYVVRVDVGGGREISAKTLIQALSEAPEDSLLVPQGISAPRPGLLEFRFRGGSK